MRTPVDETVDLKSLMDIVKTIQADMSKSLRSDEHINKKLDSIQSNLQPMKKEIATHTREIKDLKQEIFRKRMVIFGMNCEPNEPRDELKRKLITGKLEQQDFTTMEIDICRRIGSRAQRKKPILLALTTERRKHKLLRSNKLLQDTDVRIKEDLPVEVRAKRKELIPQMNKLRQEGKFAIIRYDQLIVHDHVEQPTGSRAAGGQKRALSQSPAETFAHASKKYNSAHSPLETSYENTEDETVDTPGDMEYDSVNNSFLGENYDEGKNGP